MTTEAISESGMTFGPYPEGQCFHIEKSDCYRRIQKGVQTAEFLLLRQQSDGPTVWIVEAKSSCPRELDVYINEIREKLSNSFMLAVACCLGRHPQYEHEIPKAFRDIEVKTAGFRFILVVKGVPEYHLEVLQNALDAALKPVVKSWAIQSKSVVVLNEINAQTHGLILPVVRATQ
jgi:hypothetical protein